MSRFRAWVSLRTWPTAAAVIIAAFLTGMYAVGDPRIGKGGLAWLTAAADTPSGQSAERLRCASEHECFRRIAACIAQGGEWLGNEKGGRCRMSDDR